MLQEFKKQAHLEVGAGWRQKVGVREELAFTLATITSSRAVTLACPFGGRPRGGLSRDDLLWFSKSPFQRYVRTGSETSRSSDDSCGSWHRECAFQGKPRGAGASRVGMSLNLKPLGISVLVAGPEATGMNKVNAMPSRGQNALLAWSLGLIIQAPPQESSKAKMLVTVLW